MFNLSVERSLNFNRHTKEDIHPFAHFFTHKCSSPWCGAGGSQSRRERKASLAVAIIKAGMWKAPLESYGVLWGACLCLYICVYSNIVLKVWH